MGFREDLFSASRWIEPIPPHWIDPVVARVPRACHSLPLQDVNPGCESPPNGRRNRSHHENAVSGGGFSLGDARCSAAGGCPRARGAGVLRLVLGLRFRLVGRVGVLVLGSTEGVVVRRARGREGSSHYPAELASDLLESVVRLTPSLFEPVGS